MTVKEFVADTLVQIVEGVQTAQTRIAKSGAAINRTGMNFLSDQLEGRRFDPNTSELEEMVRFDIGVTAEGGTGTKGGVGVFIGSIALGSQGQSTTKDSKINRVQFSVPIVYPPSERTQNHGV